MRRRVVCLPCSRGDGALHRTLAPPSLTSLFHSPSVLTCFMKLTSTFFAMTSGAEREEQRTAAARRNKHTFHVWTLQVNSST